jgi:CMP-N-acetylneuraminic acid synthetase
MVINESRICVILARSGSKRVPKKNLQLINEKTLIQLAIECCAANNIKTIIRKYRVWNDSDTGLR